MSSTLEFRRPLLLARRRDTSADSSPKRPLGNKLQEIAMRSPTDLAAIEVIADFVLARLDDHDRIERSPASPCTP